MDEPKTLAEWLCYVRTYEKGDTMKTKPKHYYCLLPNGNRDQWPVIDYLLKYYRIPHSICERPYSRCYRFTAKQAAMLPTWRGKMTLPAGWQEGFGIYQILDSTLKVMKLTKFKACNP